MGSSYLVDCSSCHCHRQLTAERRLLGSGMKGSTASAGRCIVLAAVAAAGGALCQRMKGTSCKNTMAKGSWHTCICLAPAAPATRTSTPCFCGVADMSFLPQLAAGGATSQDTSCHCGRPGWFNHQFAIVTSAGSLLGCCWRGGAAALQGWPLACFHYPTTRSLANYCPYSPETLHDAGLYPGWSKGRRVPLVRRRHQPKVQTAARIA